MRQGMSIALVLSLIFSPALYAKEPSKKNIRVEDYFVKPETDLSWMTDRERAAYISFLYSLQVLIEAELAGDMVLAVPESLQKNPSRKTSKAEVILQLFDFGISPSQAQTGALAKLLTVTGALVKQGTQKSAGSALALVGENSKALATQVIRQGEKFMGDAEVVAKPMLENASKGVETATKAFKSSSLAKSLGLASAAGVATLASTQLSDGSVPKAPSGAPASAAPAADASNATPAAPAAPSPAAANSEASAAAGGGGSLSHAVHAGKYRREGMYCIFGGHSSAYKAAGNRVICPAPEGTVNNKICEGTGFSPNFLCQSLGLSENAKTMEVTKKLCVPLRGEKGLADLTIRCADAFINDFLPSVRAVDPQKLAEIQAQIEQGLKAVESKRGLEDVGLLQYCESGNSLNKKLQAGPCGALMQMMNAVRKEIPVLAKSAQSGASSRATGSAATPASKGPSDGAH